jgi:hypothetical protein
MIAEEAKPATAALGARRSSPVVLVQVQMQMRGRIRQPAGIQKGTCSIVCCLFLNSIRRLPGGMSDWRMAGSGPQWCAGWQKIVEMAGRLEVGIQGRGEK